MFQKALEKIDKSESSYWANVWWILAANNFTFEEVISDFRKKNILWTDFEGGKLARIYLGKENSLMTYIMLKKNLTSLYVREKICNFRGLGKKILTQTKSPIAPSPATRGSEVSEET